MHKISGIEAGGHTQLSWPAGTGTELRRLWRAPLALQSGLLPPAMTIQGVTTSSNMACISKELFRSLKARLLRRCCPCCLLYGEKVCRDNLSMPHSRSPICVSCVLQQPARCWAAQCNQVFAAQYAGQGNTHIALLACMEQEG